LTPFETYVDWIALRAHFTTDYDYFKYGGKIRATIESFNVSPARFTMEKISKRNDAHQFLISMTISSLREWIVQAAKDPAMLQYHIGRMKRVESLGYTVTSEVRTLYQDKAQFNDALRITEERHPTTYRNYLQDGMSLETLTVLTHLTGAIHEWDALLAHDPVWSDMSRTVKKYYPFLQFDAKEMTRKIVEAIG